MPSLTVCVLGMGACQAPEAEANRTGEIQELVSSQTVDVVYLEQPSQLEPVKRKQPVHRSVSTMLR